MEIILNGNVTSVLSKNNTKFSIRISDNNHSENPSSNVIYTAPWRLSLTLLIKFYHGMQSTSRDKWKYFLVLLNNFRILCKIMRAKNVFIYSHVAVAMNDSPKMKLGKKLKVLFASPLLFSTFFLNFFQMKIRLTNYSNPKQPASICLGSHHFICVQLCIAIRKLEVRCNRTQNRS